jgi:hypothetical protein
VLLGRLLDGDIVILVFFVFEVLEVAFIVAFVLDDAEVVLNGVGDKLLLDEESEVVLLLNDVEFIFFFLVLVVFLLLVLVDLFNIVLLEEVEEAGYFLDLGDNLDFLLL